MYCYTLLKKNIIHFFFPRRPLWLKWRKKFKLKKVKGRWCI